MARKSVRELLPLGLMLIALLAFVGIHVRYRRVREAENSLSSFIRHLGRSEFSQAQSEIDKAVSISPQNAHYLANQALLHERALQSEFEFDRWRNPELGAEQRRHVEEAIRQYQQVLELNPSDDFVYHNLGWLYWLLQDKQRAAECLHKALSIDYSVPLYHVSNGLLHEYTDDLQGAAGEYALALQMSPGLLDSRFYAELRQRAPEASRQIVADSIARLEEQLGGADNPMLKAKLGKLYLPEQPDKARPLLEAAATQLPNLYRSWFNLGYAYELQGDEQQMERCYQKSSFINRLEALPHFRLGAYYDRQGRPNDAIRYYRLALNARSGQTSAHSTRVRRIYLSNYTVRDDIMPHGLFTYLSPDFDLRWTYSRLSELYRQTGDAQSADQYRQRAAELTLRSAVEP